MTLVNAETGEIASHVLDEQAAVIAVMDDAIERMAPLRERLAALSSPAPVPPAVERTGPRPAADDAHRGRTGDHYPDKHNARPAATGRAHTNNS